MNLFQLSVAHRNSAHAVFDPAYSVFQPAPGTVNPEGWLYPRAEYECFLLRQMRKACERLKLKVGYPGTFHTPVSSVHFRRTMEPGSFSLRVNGTLSASFNGGELIAERQENDRFFFELNTPGILFLHVCVNAVESMLPSILPDSVSGWEASIDGEHYEAACPGGNPFGDRFPVLRLNPAEYAPGRYDAGCELLSKVRIFSRKKPVFGFGESKFELENTDPVLSEQTLELNEIRSGVWETPDPLAFRYLRAEAENPVRVECDAEFTPVRYTGAFASDPELSRIWMSSAYTLRLCMRHFLIDGIKRDRLPWAGDLALSLLANAYSFADPEQVRKTLTVLGRAGIRKTHINGIVDYSLWLLIAHDLYQRYFSDPAFLKRQYAEITDMVLVLLEQAENGFLPCRDYPVDWLFVDWVRSQHAPEREWSNAEKQTTLQIHFFWALNSAAALADRMNDSLLAGRCRNKAEQLKHELLNRAFDPAAGLFRANMDNPSCGFYRHANYYAVLSGLIAGREAQAVMRRLCSPTLPPVGTPYQEALEILAMSRTGCHDAALATIRRIWGGMLKLGATTFFEAYDESLTGNSIYAFYNRPYGLSLCHAWSAGPAALLPILLFGCEPASDGWRTFRVAPSPLLRDGDAATVPTPLGEIRLWMENGQLHQEIPAGAVRID